MAIELNNENESMALKPEKTKRAYKTPELKVHGKVEKLTLQTGGGIPGGGFVGFNVIP